MCVAAAASLASPPSRGWLWTGNAASGRDAVGLIESSRRWVTPCFFAHSVITRSPSLQTNSAGNVMFDIPSGAEVGMMQQGAYTRFATATDVQSLAAAQISTTASMQTSMSM